MNKADLVHVFMELECWIGETARRSRLTDDQGNLDGGEC